LIHGLTLKTTPKRTKEFVRVGIAYIATSVVTIWYIWYV
jgi:hypothetical protein